MEWCKYGNYESILRPRNCPKIDTSVVYMYIFCGKPHRVIYIGTATTGEFRNRVLRHRRHLLAGQHTIFRFEETKNEDIYRLMSLAGDDYTVKSIDEYVGFLKSNIENIWLPKNYHPGKHHFGDDQIVFDEGWVNYVKDQYLPLISIWYCALREDQIKTLESQIQIKFMNSYRIGYYRYTPNNSWLGKIENLNCFNLEFTWNKIPNELEDQDKELLHRLFKSNL